MDSASTATSTASLNDAAAADVAPKAEDDEALPLLTETQPTQTQAAPSPAGRGATVSAVYRWYEIEEGFGAKRREESAIAKCRLCGQQGKPERKLCVRFSKSVTSNLWRHLKENHPDVYEQHAGEKKSVRMNRLVGKKRGRKKKSWTPSIEVGQEQRGDAAKTAKKGKGETHAQLFPDCAVGGALQHQAGRQTGAANATASGTVASGNFNPEKVREAVGYFCLYEMLPFELCSSHAFRNLMVECSGGAEGYVDGSNSFALFAKEIAFGYAKKMAAYVKVRTVMQTKMTDFAHLMISEWRSSNCVGANGAATGVSAVSTGYDAGQGDGDMTYLALFAVGLDQEFNMFRRCLHVLSIDSCHSENSIITELARDKELKKAMERVIPCRNMPQVLAVEPTCKAYDLFCTDHNLQFLESVTTLLQNIMIATVNEVNITESYCLGHGVFTAANTSGIQNRRLDKGEYIECSSAAFTLGSSSDAFYGLPGEEVASKILEELPSNLSGHTYRDLMNKVLYLVAHFKQSINSRKVLRKIAIDECSMTTDTFERVFINRLRDLVISVGGIYYVLRCAVDMMPTFKKYFEMHQDGITDFSKLIQLASLSRYEWSRIGYLKTILKPFADAIAKLDGEQYFISSLIVPSVSTLLEKLQSQFNDAESGTIFLKKSDETVEAVGDLPEDIEALRTLAFTNLSECFGYLFSVPEASWIREKRKTFNLLWAATIVDPRTRSFIVKGPLSQEDFWEVVKAEAAHIAGTKKKEKENGNDLGESSISLDDEDSGHLDGSGDGKSTDLWDDLQANLTSCAQEEMLLSSSKSSLEITKSSNLLEVEVSIFQEDGSIPLCANPLEWWQSVRMKYPFLSRLARYVLSIPCNVKVNDNPVLCDGGLVKRAQSEMSLSDQCELLAASMNLRTEKNAHFEAASKQMWSTV